MTVNTLQGSADFDTKQSCAVLCTSKMFAQPTIVKTHPLRLRAGPCGFPRHLDSPYHEVVLSMSTPMRLMAVGRTSPAFKSDSSDFMAARTCASVTL